MTGDRIRQVRELRGQTQIELADEIGIAQSAIAQMEAGSYEPSESVLGKIALLTGFETDFFRQETTPIHFSIGSFLYRAQTKVTAKDKAKAHRLAQLMFEAVGLMRNKLRPIKVLLPRIREEPVVTARLVRASMGLSPDSPIGNLTHSIERLGVLVLHLPLEAEGLDGFSAWVGTNGEIPVMCLLSGKNGFRPRFTAGEELGHLAMHSPLIGNIKKADDEARRFSGELLLPREALIKEVFTPVTLTSLAPLKRRWSASYALLIRRLFDLELISANQYKYLNMQLSSRGWRRQEPGDLAVVQEQPLAFRKMVEVIYGNPPDLQKMRQDLHGVPLSLLKSLLIMDVNTAPAKLLHFPGGRPSNSRTS